MEYGPHEAEGIDTMPRMCLACIRPSIYVCGVNLLCSTFYRPDHSWVKSAGPELRAYFTDGEMEIHSRKVSRVVGGR